MLRPQGAKLCKYPKSLYVFLWQEYEFGLEGNKPAKLYYLAERGANKFGATWIKFRCSNWPNLTKIWKRQIEFKNLNRNGEKYESWNNRSLMCFKM